MINVHDVTQAFNLLPNGVRAASFTGADFDIRQLIGKAKLIFDAAPQGSGITTSVALQDSPDVALGANFETAGDADLKLNVSTSGKTKQAVRFTQDGDRQIKTIVLKLKQAGAIAAGKKLTLTIEADSSGDPSGAPLGTAGTVLCSAVAATYGWVVFTFTTPVDLTDTDVYWLVLTGDYDASDSNYIAWSVLTVGSDGTVSGFATDTWTPVTTLKGLFYGMEYDFADVSAVTLTPAQTDASFQAVAVPIDGLNTMLRAKGTVAGGSATGATSLTLIGRPQVI